MLAALLPLMALAGGQSLNPPQAIKLPEKWGYDSLHEYARCVITKVGDEVDALFTKPPVVKGSVNLDRVARFDGCFSVEGTWGENFTLRMSPAALRGALAEELYLRTYKSPPEFTPPDQPAPFQGSGDPAQASYDVAACTAQRDPVGADMLVRAKLKSAGEARALGRLRKTIAGCMPAGRTLGFDREALHGMIAEGLLKWRRAAAAEG